MLISFVATVAGLALLIAGCAQAGPPPTPTRAPAVPTKAAEPTKPAAAAPAPTKAPEPTKAVEAPAKKVVFPEKGKSITYMDMYAAGGSSDVTARLLAPFLEKDLGTPVQVVNKPGAGSQIGLTELSLAKPDGYTIGHTNMPSSLASYLDPERKAVYTRKSFEPLTTTFTDPYMLAVKSESPFKTMKDLLDAAKANPEKIKVAEGTGPLGGQHLLLLLLEKETGAKFAVVHFDGGGPAYTAMLGGHVDVTTGTSITPRNHVKTGEVRVLAVAGTKEVAHLPGTRTLQAQGYNVLMGSTHTISAPAGTPREIVERLGEAFKRALETDEVKKRSADIGLTADYRTPSQAAAFWDDMEARVAPIIKSVARK